MHLDVTGGVFFNSFKTSYSEFYSATPLRLHQNVKERKKETGGWNTSKLPKTEVIRFSCSKLALCS